MAEDNGKAVQEIARLTKQTATVQTVGNTPFIIVPKDSDIIDLSKYVENTRTDRPTRKEGTVTVFDAASFAEYYALFSDEHSRVFADELGSKFVAVLDYHEAGELKARWGRHRIDLTLRHSEEWKRWSANNGKKLTQMEFSEFLEDNAPDILMPDAATMLDVARDLRARTEVDFGSAIRMNNGSVQFKFSEQVKGSFGSGNLDVPERFVVSIPVYLGSDRIRVEARLRYRINSGKLTFWYDLLRADLVQRDAFAATRSDIGTTINVTVINGRPAGA